MNHRLTLALLAALLPAAAGAQDQYLGEMRWVAFNFAPSGWAHCNGQLLPIAEFDALFTLLGTTYGGDGQETFALPDLRSRTARHFADAPHALQTYLGETGGTETVSLIPTQMPAHAHSLHATTAMGNATSPTGALLARPSVAGPDGAAPAEARIYRNIAPNAALGSGSLTTAGASQPHENMNPYLGLNCIIALEGIFPQQN